MGRLVSYACFHIHNRPYRKSNRKKVLNFYLKPCAARFKEEKFCFRPTDIPKRYLVHSSIPFAVWHQLEILNFTLLLNLRTDQISYSSSASSSGWNNFVYFQWWCTLIYSGDMTWPALTLSLRSLKYVGWGKKSSIFESHWKFSVTVIFIILSSLFRLKLLSLWPSLISETLANFQNSKFLISDIRKRDKTHLPTVTVNLCRETVEKVCRKKLVSRGSWTVAEVLLDGLFLFFVPTAPAKIVRVIAHPILVNPH